MHSSHSQSAKSTSHSLCQLKTFSQSQVVEQLSPVVSSAVSSRLTKKLKSSVSVRLLRRQLLQALKCSVSSSTKDRLARTSDFFSVEQSVKMLSVVRLSASQVQSHLTQSSMHLLTSFQRMKEDVTLHSSTTTVHSSTSVQLT